MTPNIDKFENNILISIITASYNSKNTIEKTIKSVINKKTQNIEYIIIDGGSSDGTVDIIYKYKKNIDYYISEKDNGIYDAWNKGIINSRGKYIAFLGSDDLLCENYFDVYIPEVLKNSNIDYISTKMFIKENNKIFGKPWNWVNFRKTMNVVHPGSLHNRDLFYKHGLYDINFKIAGDYEFLLRIGADLNSIFIDIPTVVFCTEGVSSKTYYKTSKEIRDAKIKNKSRSLFMINIEFLNRIIINTIIIFKNKFFHILTSITL